MPYYAPTIAGEDGPWAGYPLSKRWLYYVADNHIGDPNYDAWRVYEDGTRELSGLTADFFETFPKNQAFDFNPFDCDDQ